MIRGGFTLFATEARAYFGERILRPRVVLMWLLVLIGILLTTSAPMSRWPWLAVTSALFILAFRLWDDLEDLAYDRAHHSERCLVRSAHRRTFYAALWMLLIGLAALLFFVWGGGRALAFIAMLVAFLAIYALTAMRPDQRAVRTALVLVKYPGFVVLLADAPGDRMVAAVALGLYLPPLVDEVRSAGTGVLVAAAGVLGIAALAWLALMA